MPGRNRDPRSGSRVWYRCVRLASPTPQYGHSAQPAYRVPRAAYCAHTGRSQIALYYQGAVYYYGSRLDSRIRLWIVNRPARTVTGVRYTPVYSAYQLGRGVFFVCSIWKLLHVRPAACKYRSRCSISGTRWI